MIKQLLFVILIACCVNLVYAQANTDTLRSRAQAFIIHGDYDNALLVLNHAAEMDAGNIDILKDEAYVYYLQRNFAKTIEIGKSITSRSEADVQSYQVLGLAYKATADYINCDKLYKKAIKQYPNSGALYSDYGDLLAQQSKPDEAIKYWEKGIQVDANNSSNYYYAARYYSQKNKPLWAVLYSETFTNIESLTQRTVEIKDILLSNYRKLLTTDVLNALSQSTNPFEKAIADIYSNYSSLYSNAISPEQLTAIRTRFVLDWYKNNTPLYNYRLFDHQQLLLQQGMFDAYNEWLFGASASSSAYQFWVSNHAPEVKQWQTYLRSVVYKIPAGQYFQH
jgi:tetratricopeptide (TPR) repeat protein